MTRVTASPTCFLRPSAWIFGGGKLSPSWNGKATRTHDEIESLVSKKVDFAQGPSVRRGNVRACHHKHANDHDAAELALQERSLLSLNARF
jgi:hypothetical protein